MKIEVIRTFDGGFDVVGVNAFVKHFDTETFKNQYLFKLRSLTKKIGPDSIWMVPSSPHSNEYEFYHEHSSGRYYIIRNKENKIVKVPGKDNAEAFARSLSLKDVVFLN